MGLRDVLLDAALGLLERGEEPGLRAVARAAGVSAMAPYRHFSDKGALLGAVAGAGFVRLREALERAEAGFDGEAALVAQGKAYLDFARGHPELFRLMFAGHPGAKEAADGEAYAVLARRAATLVPGGAETATLACWAVVHGLAALEGDGRLADPAVGEAALRLVVKGLARVG